MLARIMNTPPTIPDHTLLRPIGRGSYGEVWLARNVMGVLRAVKVVEQRQFDSDRPYEREFEGIQRYEPVSRMTDGLVHVLHVGRNDAEGYFYYVMELADAVPGQGDEKEQEGRAGVGGEIPFAPFPFSPSPPFSPATYQPRTLRSDLKRLHRLPTADCVRVALDVVGGLAKLHEHGLVHRDVKPGNIILVNGRAKLADIGLVSTSSEGRTFVGTEGYIPPEGPGTRAADIYALGMGLYEAATGYPPERFPKVPPEWFAEDAGTEAIEFHEVVLKACEGARERRYQSAEQMHADLALLQSGQSVRRVRALERRAARTQRFAWAAAIVVTIAVAATLVANWRARIAEQMRRRESALLQQARDARVKESGARARAEGAERDARQQLNAALFEQARALVLSKELGHRTRALEALRRATGVTNAAELRRVAFAALGLPDLRLERELRLDPALTLLQPDPKFERIALGRGPGPVMICSLREAGRNSRRGEAHSNSGQKDQSLPTLAATVAGLDTRSSAGGNSGVNLEVLVTLPASTNRDVYQAAWSADGRFLAVKRQHDMAGVRSDWEVWNLAQTQRVLIAQPDIAHASVTFHPQRPLFMAGRGGGRVTEWDLETGRQLRTFRFPNTPHALVYSPDGKRLAASYRRDTNWVVAFHDATTMKLLRAVDYPEGVESLAWHPQGRWVSGNGVNPSQWARGVHLIEADTGRVTTLGEHKIKAAYSVFTGDGHYLVSGGWEREIICWDLRTLRRAFTYAGAGYRHCWSADGRRCAVELPDNGLQFYGFERPEDRKLSGNPGDAVREGQFSSDGRWFAVREDEHLCIWDLGGAAPATLVRVPRKTTTAFFSPDSRELFVVPDNYAQRGYLGRWRLTPSTDASAPPLVESLPVRLPNGFIGAALVSNELVMTSAEGVHFVALTNLAQGKARVVRVPPGLGYVSPNGRWLAMLYNYSPVVRVYRLPAMEEVARLQTSNFVGFITFSPNSDEMLVLNRSGAEWFDTATWRCTRRQPGAPVSGSYAFYTPGGDGIWMVTHFRNAALLDRRTLEPLLPLPNDVLPLALSPDGRHLAVSVESRRVEIWDVAAFRREFAKLGFDW
jgi:WD40 repeat protein